MTIEFYTMVFPLVYTPCSSDQLAMREEEGVPCAFTRISLLPSVAMIDVGLVLRRVPLQVRSC